ncbi:polysaccharide biosynthesis/export family protein [Rhodoplanes sp. TEM]|uniref:Polysaccharide biosynthesis/export family protein n=1 Tax=Rhodoplanes tepidamans TaxID=200616 RepID=A0ABT5J6E9_RHOTP|nr:MULTISPECIES: polysaccharide biosynthesis/export family protein [Rhodoplanes]MDC7785232.1 polysaccharide biosynthesis/export family protein [Rhodoplanes tepidamans]MDC7986416.1 polysaccharide biosynthesis/export family protein [Rhodoplanes sp. TEM]MDQ0353490.1 protein involved in polysaccharide export with SLBB domain [Rhodoplanes tepidamans]
MTNQIEGRASGVQTAVRHRLVDRLDRRTSRFVSALLAAAVALWPPTAPAEPYRLGPQDKLRLKVIEWRAGKGEYQEWLPLNAEYVVNMAGNLAIPLIGEVPAAGRTTGDVATAISDALQRRAGLASRPDAAVEIVQYRPVYVVGEVERPGEYAYRPDLTPLQLLGLAGGMQRVSEAGLIRLERDRIVAAGSLESARLELRRNLARRARLEAELEDKPSLRHPSELPQDEESTRLIADETTLLRSRRDALQSQLTALSELEMLYAKEVTSLTNKIASQQKQIALAHRELKNVGSLVEKGLAVNAREFSMQRTVAELESKLLDFETASLRAQQEGRKAARDATDLRKERRAKIVAELQETRGAIEQLGARLNTANALIDEATVTAPRLTLERAASAVRVPVFSVVRTTGSTRAEIAADENTPLAPGDVLRVEKETRPPTSTVGALRPAEPR